MTWWPISRASLDEMIDADLTNADERIREIWKHIAIEPQKWRCSPWGDEGGGFWVVGVGAGWVVWFNDIEDGFNISPFTESGIISEYVCNQDNLARALYLIASRTG